ncbi:MAG: FAD/NAD(P)-binding protein [Thermoplasmatales archaeon]|nr:FAD/NAD(P)-binding protein [Thermoplasmatales archaeon]
MNPFTPLKGKIIENRTINDKKFLRVETENFSFIPGQFVEISIAGVGEFPISICSPPYEKNFFEVCIRKVGRVTSFLYNNKIDYLLYRGPFGNGFPMKKLEGKNIVVIIGGLGILPLRSFIKEAIHSKIYNQMKILYGARSRDDLLFAEEIEEWKNYAEVYKIFEKEGMKRGFVTELIDEIVFDGKEYILICGPPAMFKPVIEKALKMGADEEKIYVSVERRMKCGIGKCGHCIIGSYYSCIDGPVFEYAKYKHAIL